MEWQAYLHDGEEVRWCGRPAPRCFTFRRWIHSLFGLLLLPLVWLWYDGGQTLAESRGEQVWGLVPWLGMVVAAYFVVGHLIQARLAWERTFYAITDRRVLTTGGWPIRHAEHLALNELQHIRLRPRGVHLGSLHLRGREPQRQLILTCLEHPDKPLKLLEAAVQNNLQAMRQVEDGPR